MSTLDRSTNDDGAIEKRLTEMEADIKYPSQDQRFPVSLPTGDLLKHSHSMSSMKEDLYYFAGLALIGFSVLVFFQHVHVGTGLLQALGMGTGGFGLLIIPLLVGIGMIVYNSKNKIGYVIVSITCALIFYAVLASLIVTFSPVSLLGLITMLAPLAIGAAFMIKGLGGPAAIEQRLINKGIIKGCKSIESEK